MLPPVNWKRLLRETFPKGRASILDGLAAAMPRVIAVAQLNTAQRLAHFLGQCAHESDGFLTMEEYASGAAYEGRKDLGNTVPGDGRRFKGRGIIQLTGRENYRDASERLGVDLIGNPKLAGQMPLAALVAADYWITRKCNAQADKDSVPGVTRIINGGQNGLADRARYTTRAKNALNPVRLAQLRLAELNYPCGKADGEVGALTRSAIRDFQDANGLKVTGSLDAATMARLSSPKAEKRPVSKERAELTSEKLAEEGSTTVTEVITAKNALRVATGAIGTAGVVGAEVSDVADNAMSVMNAVDSTQDVFSWVTSHWEIVALILALVVIVFLFWRLWAALERIEKSRLEDARNGVNVKY